MAKILAAADIGSNTAHLLVAATDGDIVMRIDNLNEWISLGEAVARTGQIPKEHADQLVGALKEFKTLVESKRADRFYVFATEAVRAAKNHSSVLKRIKSETGIVVDVISPQKEAEYSFRGVRLDTKEIEPDLVFEVGGGSAQVAMVESGEIVSEVSLPLGTGKLLAESGIQNPCSAGAKKAAEDYIGKALKACDFKSPKNAVGLASGGVARGLWRALHPDGEKRLALAEIEYLIWATERLSTERIIERFNVKPKRAGTLLPGALVYVALMRKFGVEDLAISEFGVREGAILNMAKGNIKGQSL